MPAGVSCALDMRRTCSCAPPAPTLSLPPRCTPLPADCGGRFGLNVLSCPAATMFIGVRMGRFLPDDPDLIFDHFTNALRGGPYTEYQWVDHFGLEFVRGAGCEGRAGCLLLLSLVQWLSAAPCFVCWGAYFPQTLLCALPHTLQMCGPIPSPPPPPAAGLRVVWCDAVCMPLQGTTTRSHTHTRLLVCFAGICSMQGLTAFLT